MTGLIISAALHTVNWPQIHNKRQVTFSSNMNQKLYTASNYVWSL